jgi:MFS family permease
MTGATAPAPGSEASRAATRRVAPAVVVGSALEWYDFYLFASMAALVFGDVFFPGQSSVAGALSAAATFAVGFVVRPVGAMLFGFLGDKVGRKRVLAWTFILMGLSSGAMGLIPSYASIGVWAPALLVLFRLTQGLGAGAEFASAIAASYEHASSGRRGWFGSLPALGVNIGLFASSLTVTVITSFSHAFVVEWGWRIPFVASFALVALGVWVRRRMPETPEFEQLSDERDVRKNATPLRDLFRSDWKGAAVVALVTIGYLTSSYLFKTFSLTYLTEFRDVAANVGSFGVTLASGLAILTVPLAGRMCDRFDSGTVLKAGAGGIAVLAFPFFWALDTTDKLPIWAIMIVTTGVVIPAMLAATGDYFARQFPTEVRASGIGTGKELGGISGGLAPLIGLSLVNVTPGNATWAVSLVFVACAGFVVVGVMLDQRTKVLARAGQPSGTRRDRPTLHSEMA